MNDDGSPAPCVVRIHPLLAAALYRECVDNPHRRETELVNAIVAAWAARRGPVDWPALRERIRAACDGD
jgi:hypothetical protein